MDVVYKPIRAHEIPRPEELNGKYYHIRFEEEDLDLLEKAFLDKGWEFWGDDQKEIGQMNLDSQYRRAPKQPSNKVCGRCTSYDCGQCYKMDHCDYFGGENGVFCYFVTENTHVEAPRNNDGRLMCYWCNIPTQLRGGGMYNVCPRCGK